MSVSAPAPAPSPLQLRLEEAGETSVRVSYRAPAAGLGVAAMRLFVREFPKPWAEARVIDLPLAGGGAAGGGGGDAASAVVSGLFPTASFELRMAYVFADGRVGEAGPELSADTLAAGCTPKAEEKDKGGGGGAKKKKCAVV